MANEKLNSTQALQRSWIPGLGHLALGQKKKGTRLLLATILLSTFILWFHKRILDAFSGPFWDQWLAALVLIFLPIGLVWFSRWDVKRLLRSSDGSLRRKDPLRLALDRFRENRLAVGAVWVIVALYLLALLAPLLAPYRPQPIAYPAS